MRILGRFVGCLMGLAWGAFVAGGGPSQAAAAEPPLTAEDALAKLTADETTSAQRESWFEANAKGKSVIWEAPVFNVTPSAELVLVNAKVSSRGLFACNVPKRLQAAASAVKPGEPVLCKGRIEDFETLGGAAIVNIAADDFVAGAKAIETWRAAPSRAKTR